MAEPAAFPGGIIVKARFIGGIALVAASVGCAGPPTASAPTTDATTFLAQANQTLEKLGIEGNQAGWVAQNFITDDTEALDARATQMAADAGARFAKEATRFDKVQVPAGERRQLDLLKLSLVLATPSNGQEAEQLTRLISSMRATYGK